MSAGATRASTSARCSPAPAWWAMQYSPLGALRGLSLVDAGTVELVRSFGVEVVSSAALVQRFIASIDEAGWASHVAACDALHAILDETWRAIGHSLARGERPTEYTIRELILGRYRARGLTADGAVPIVAVNGHAGVPGFIATPETAVPIRPGDRLFVDVWARGEAAGAILRRPHVVRLRRRRADAGALPRDLRRGARGARSRGGVRPRAARGRRDGARGGGGRRLPRPRGRGRDTATRSTTARGTRSARRCTTPAPTSTTSRARTTERWSLARCSRSSRASTSRARWACARRSDAWIDPAGTLRIHGPVQAEIVRIEVRAEG